MGWRSFCGGWLFQNDVDRELGIPGGRFLGEHETPILADQAPPGVRVEQKDSARLGRHHLRNREAEYHFAAFDRCWRLCQGVSKEETIRCGETAGKPQGYGKNGRERGYVHKVIDGLLAGLLHRELRPEAGMSARPGVFDGP